MTFVGFYGCFCLNDSTRLGFVSLEAPAKLNKVDKRDRVAHVKLSFRVDKRGQPR